MVRGIVELGEIELHSDAIVGSGSSKITLPAAYDENDLSVHLIYQFNMPAEEPEPVSPPTDTTSPEEERVPAASLLASLCVVLGAALIRRE